MVPLSNKFEESSNIKLLLFWGIGTLEYGTIKIKGDNFKLINSKGSFLATTIFGVLSLGRHVELVDDSGKKSPRRFFTWFWHFSKEEKVFVSIFWV